MGTLRERIRGILELYAYQTINNTNGNQKKWRGAGVVADKILALLPQRVIVSLGDMYADKCTKCGARGEWGVASKKGPVGCQEALDNGEVYCIEHLPQISKEGS